MSWDVLSELELLLNDAGVEMINPASLRLQFIGSKKGGSFIVTMISNIYSGYRTLPYSIIKGLLGRK